MVRSRKWTQKATRRKRRRALCVVSVWQGYWTLLSSFIRSFIRFVPTTCGTAIHIYVPRFMVCWARERRGFVHVILRLCWWVQTRNEHATLLLFLFCFGLRSKSCLKNEMLLIWHRSSLCVCDVWLSMLFQTKTNNTFHCQDDLSICLYLTITLIILFCTEHAP